MGVILFALLLAAKAVPLSFPYPVTRDGNRLVEVRGNNGGNIYTWPFVIKGSNLLMRGGTFSDTAKTVWNNHELWRYFETGNPHLSDLWNPSTNPTDVVNAPGAVQEAIFRARELRSNTIRIFLDVDSWGGVPGKNFNMSGHLEQLDNLLAFADSQGMKVIVTFYDGYNVRIGCNAGSHGQLGDPNSDAYWTAAPAYLAHALNVVAHYHNDTRILAWDLMNEPDHLYHTYQGCSPVYSSYWVKQWLARVADEIRNAEARDAYPHLLTVGTYGWFLDPNPDPNCNRCHTASTISPDEHEKALWGKLDFISIHWYENAAYLSDALTKTTDALNANPSTPGGRPVVLEEIGRADAGKYGTGCAQTNPWNQEDLRAWTVAWTAIASQSADGALAWMNTDATVLPGGGCPDSNEAHFGLFSVPGVSTIEYGIKPAGRAFRDGLYQCTTPYVRFKSAHGNYVTAPASSGVLYLSGATDDSTKFTMFALNRHMFGLHPKLRQDLFVNAVANPNDADNNHLRLSATPDATSWYYYEPLSKQQTDASGPFYYMAFKPRVALTGTFVVAEPPPSTAIHEDRDWIGPWERFEMHCAR